MPPSSGCLFGALLLLSITCHGILGNPRVYWIEPRDGGAGGEVYITIWGADLAESAITNLTKAYLVTAYHEKECPIVPEMSMETRIQCISPALDRNTWYYIRVVIDGVDVLACSSYSTLNNQCGYYAHDGDTPVTEEVFPRSGTPPILMEARGKTYTDRYGSTTATSSNGRTQEMRRAFAGPSNCDFIDLETDTLYGLQTTGWTRGYLKCMLRGTFIGNANFTFIASTPLGRSRSELGLYHVSQSGQLYMVQTYAVVTSLSHSEGSIAGGLSLSIDGDYFGTEAQHVDVKIGRAPCIVTSVTRTRIICTTPSQRINDTYPGGRGVIFSLYRNDQRSLEQLLEKDDFDEPSNTTFADQLAFCDSRRGRPNCVLDLPQLDQNSFTLSARGIFVVPWNGVYRFLVRGDDVVFFNASCDGIESVLIAYTESPRNGFFDSPQQGSNRTALTAGIECHYNLLFNEHTSAASFDVAVAYYDTLFESSQSGMAVNEEQTITISTAVVHEVQNITLNNLQSQAAAGIAEVQSFQHDKLDSCYQLCYRNVCTVALSSDNSAADLEAALLDLPGFSEQVVESVSQTIDNATHRAYDITFHPSLGNHPLLTVNDLAAPSSPMVTEKIAGSADRTFLRLSSGQDIVSGVIDTGAEITADVMYDALIKAFQTECPGSITQTAGKIFLEDMENEDTANDLGGTADMEEEPFCGRTSRLNPTYVINSVEGITAAFNRKPVLCFAYKGRLQSRVTVWLTVDGESTSMTMTDFEYFQDGEWHFTCHLIAPSGTIITITKAQVFKDDNNDDFHLDQVSVSYGPPMDTSRDSAYNIDSYSLLSTRRRVGPRVKDLTVSKSNDTYIVDFSPQNCLNDFDLLGVDNVDHTTSDGRATYRDSNWPADMDVTSERISSATPPLGGTWILGYGSEQTNPLPADIEPADLQHQIHVGLPSAGPVGISRTGTCHGQIYTALWGSGGDKDLLTVDGSQLTGNGVTVEVVDNDGHILLSPIQGEMLRTEHTVPQVVVTVNGIPSRCLGDCSHQWSNSVTPTLSDASTGSSRKKREAVSGGEGTVLTIHGDGFGTETSEISVSIGPATCNVTSVSETELQCTVPEVPAGTHGITVVVDGMGQAFTDSTLTFVVEAVIDSFSPTAGSAEGGTAITIAGSAFTADSEVLVDGVRAVILSNSNNQLVVCTPPGTAGEVDLQVDGTTATGSFTYNGDSGHAITITPTSMSLIGGDVMISGTFPADTPTSVQASGTTATVRSSNATHVQVTLGRHSDGTVTIQLAYLDNCPFIGEVTYAMRVTDVCPQSGSVQGGTQVTITGVGFGTDPGLIAVNIGATECLVSHVTDDTIICETTYGGRTHTVRNSGSHPVYGPGYGWAPNVVDVNVGDTVEWRWSSPLHVDSQRFSVIETDSNFMQLPGGFRDPNPRSANGMFQHQFTEADTIAYYTSGCLDDNCPFVMTGAVNVGSTHSSQGVVSVTLGGMEPDYDPSSCSGSEPADIGSCTEASNSPSGDFVFEFKDCQTPTVTSITPNVGQVTDLITITGTGLLATGCNNSVTIGDNLNCAIVNNSATEITCLPSPEAGDILRPNYLYPVAVYICPRGNALLMIEEVQNKSFAIIPEVTDVDRVNGSIKGGTRLTITVAGFFGSNIVVTYRGSTSDSVCVIQSVSHGEIVCVTGNLNKEDDGMLEVTVAGIQAICESDTCNYAYKWALTPQITTESQDQICGPSTTFHLEGTELGTGSVSVGENGERKVCEVVSFNATSMECRWEIVASGSYELVAIIEGKGRANMTESMEAVSACLAIIEVSPSEGSTQGGTEITVKGYGFQARIGFGVAIVMIGGDPCDVIGLLEETQEFDILKCITRGGSGSVTVTVHVNGLSSNESSFEYSTDETPVIDSIDRNSGVAGETLVISGSNFGTNESLVEVKVGTAVCVITDHDDSNIECTLGDSAPGSYQVVVTVRNKGIASGSLTFVYELQADGSISPSSGSFGGGQIITVTGNGFYGDIQVTICGIPCVISIMEQTSLTCTTPAYEGPDADSLDEKECDVVITVGGSSVTAGTYTFTRSLTPVVGSVSPGRGGTGGGFTVTITGSGFSASEADNEVTIGGAPCNITSASTTEIQCTAGERSSTTQRAKRSASEYQCTAAATSYAGQTHVTVIVRNQGATPPENADFWYVDEWSSRFTWGYNDPPVAGDLVVIPTGQTILLDQDTPVLKALLIDGGTVIVEDKAGGVKVEAEYILITNGGTFQIGTEEEPYMNKAEVVLHGKLRAQELPVYGAKGIGVREGTLDLHGKPIRMTWTRLAQTAQAGAVTIEVERAMGDWNVDDKIVVATTGTRHSQAQNEERTIVAISDDWKTLTLNEPLEYQHLGETASYGDRTLEMRAEVGLLTRNVVIRGSRDLAWADDIEACPEGFDTGEFVTQTCFQGRFGDDAGSDQFGGHILLHSPEKDSQCAVGRFSYVELNYMGQAFKLGRYPIHFHINGDMSQSYVKGCAIHETFNRAINVHDTRNLMIEHNVVYNVMGGALFLEDGSEINNTFQYNLAVFIIASSSLLNDDVTPAAFWATNPANIHQHNAVAGGTHFAFWYRMEEHPSGPSRDTSYCPREVALGRFFNNSAHSFGWFGLWTFQDFYPMNKGGQCHTDPDDPKEAEPAVFESFTAWHCEKGAEFVNGGALQFKDFRMVANEKAGLEGKKLLNLLGTGYTSDGPMVIDSVIAGHIDGDSIASEDCTQKGLILPWSAGWSTINTTFVNFDEDSCTAIAMTSIDGTCGFLCGGYTYEFSQITWVNSPNKGTFRWPHDGVLHDMDGTLTSSEHGLANSKVLAKVGYLTTGMCKDILPFTTLGGVQAVICDPPLEFLRMAWNRIQPESLKFKNAVLTSEHGTQEIPYNFKRLTHKEGWMAILQVGLTYNFSYVDIGTITNLSYSGTFDGIGEGHEVIICHTIDQTPDRMGVKPGVEHDPFVAVPLSSENENGRIYYDYEDRTGCYAINYRDFTYGLLPSPTSNAYEAFQDVLVKFYKCFWPRCEAPLDPSLEPPPTERPDDFQSWTADPPPYDVENMEVEGTVKVVVKVTGTWVVLDHTPDVTSGGASDRKKKRRDASSFGYDVLIVDRLSTLEIAPLRDTNNQLVIDPDTGKPTKIEICAEYIIIEGNLIVGFYDDRFLGELDIVLTGDLSTELYTVQGSPPVGAKAMAVYGGLQVHGKGVGRTYTRLAEKLSAGGTTLTLVDTVPEWEVGQEIVVATTSFLVSETETFVISSINGNQLTVTAAAQYDHEGYSITNEVDGVTYPLAAEVALLERNIRIMGSQYDDQVTDGYGGRILVSTMSILVGSEVQGRTGYVLMSNTELVRMGQLGHNAPWDPRYGISVLGVGETTAEKPFMLRENVFRDGFSPAIGLYGANAREVVRNVIYHTVGGAVVVHESTGVHLFENLAITDIWPGAYADRDETANFNFEATFDTKDAGDVLLTGNRVAGTERIGYWTRGRACDGSDSRPVWSNNTVHSALTGVMVLFNYVDGSCVQIDGFIVWRAWDFGVYIQVPISLAADNLVLIENGVGIMPYVNSPSIVDSIRGGRTAKLTNSFLSGSTTRYSCSELQQDPTDLNFRRSQQARGERRSNGIEQVAVLCPSFMSGDNEATRKTWKNIMAYNAIDGLLEVTGVHFYNFSGETPCGTRDYVFSTNSGNGDLMHPTHVSNVVMTNVDRNNIAYFHRSNVGLVNPSDCVDMDCDANKKVYIKDIDGTLLGPGTSRAVVPDAEWQWEVSNGESRPPAAELDRSHGVGDFRIPPVMLTDFGGNRLPIESVISHRGIYRDFDNCVYQDTWNAWDCANVNYEMMVVESVDHDTEDRRLSPIALLSVEGQVVDLINGPQDHGWCSGYTCQQRISTFHMMVGTGITYKMYMTSTNPQRTRLFLLNTNDDMSKSLVVATYYHAPQRIDVYANGVYILPLNGQMENGIYTLTTDTTTPTPADPIGSNYFDREYQLLYVTLKGSAVIEMVIKPVVIVSLDLPPLTIDEFFGENLVTNLAAFLGVPPHKVRIVEIVADDGSRRKRASGDQSVTVEIGEPPSTTNTLNETLTGVNDPDDVLDYDALTNITRTIGDAVQTGNISAALNTTIVGVAIADPLPEPGSDEWAEATSEGTVGESVIQIPTAMLYTVALESADENVAFKTQPAITMVDSAGALVEVLGSRSNPWKVTATLVKGAGSDSNAALLGTTTVSFKNGWANFTDLGVTYSGDYSIEFRVTDPEESTYHVSSQPFSVSAAQLLLKVYNFTLTDNTSAETGPYEMYFGAVTPDDLPMQNISWRGHSWSANLTIPDSQTVTTPAGTAIAYNQTVEFDLNTGLGFMHGIVLHDIPGYHYFQVSMWSAPAGYILQDLYGPVLIPQPALSSVVASAVMQLSFPYNISAVNTTEFENIALNKLQDVANSITGSGDMLISNMEATEGSIRISFTVEAVWANGTAAYQDALATLLNDGSLTVVVNGVPYTASNYLLVNGVDGTLTTTPLPNVAEPMNLTIVIACAAVGGLLLLAIVIMIYLVCSKKGGKVEQMPPPDVEMRGDFQTPPPQYTAQDYANPDEGLPSKRRDFHYEAPKLNYD